MSPGATRAMRNEVARGSKPPKLTTFAELSRPGNKEGPHTTFVDGCERFAAHQPTHPRPPHTQSATGNLAMHSGTTYFAKPLKATDFREALIAFLASWKGASSVKACFP